MSNASLAPPSPALAAAWRTEVALVAAELVVYLPLAVLNLAAIVEKRAFSNGRELWRKIKLQVILLCILIVAFFDAALIFAYNAPGAFDPLRNSAACFALQQTTGFFYVVGKTLTYFFLFEKAAMVAKAAQASTKIRVIIIRWIVLIMILGIIPLYGTLIIIVLGGTIVSDAGICVIDVTISYFGFLGTVLTFVVTDVILASLCAFLFVVPLREVTKRLVTPDGNTGQNTVNVMIRRNLKFGVGAIISTFIGILGFVSCLVYASALEADPNLNVNVDPVILRIYGVCAASLDVFFTIVCCHLMLTDWLPRWFARRWAKSTSKASASRTAFSRLGLASQVEGSYSRFVVHRNGLETMVDNPAELLDEINAGDLIEDKGNVVSFVTKHVLKVRELDTLLGRGWPAACRKLLDIFKRASQSRIVDVLLLSLFTGVVVLIILSIVGILSVTATLWIAILVFVLLLALFASIVNIALLKRVVYTSFFWIRFASAAVSFTCLVLVTLDARIAYWVALFALQVFNATGDCLSGAFQHYRSLALVLQLEALLFLVFTIVFDLLSVSDWAVPISGTFDYSLVQLARDLYLGTLVVTLFDIYFALRVVKSRFLHLQDPVRRTLLEFGPIVNEDNHNGNFLGRARSEVSEMHVLSANRVDASQLEVHSGFLVGNSDVGQVRFFVDSVAVRQNDALAVHLFGKRLGRRCFDILTGKLYIVVEVVLVILFMASLLGSPWLNALALLSLPLPFLIAMHILVLSKRMLSLLGRMRQVRVDVSFLFIWFALACVVFENELIILQINMLLLTLKEITRDASVQSTSTIRRAYYFALLGSYYSVLAVQMIWSAYPGATHKYVDFDPSSAGSWINGTVDGGAYSDRQSVEDIFQILVDLNLSAGLGYFLRCANLLLARRRGVAEDSFENICIPVTPEFE